MVFDASSHKGPHIPSLNECLHAGPSLTSPLIDVLIRFRAHNYIVIADIEKAFLQILLSENQRSYVRFLWFADCRNIDFEHFDNNELVENEVCRVLFGLKPSPFLLNGTLRKHIMIYKPGYSDIVHELIRSLHVDDLITGKDTVDEAFSFYVQAKHLLSEGSFNLRKFKSNSKELEERVYDEFPEDKLFSGDDKCLGYVWEKRNDVILFNLQDIRKKMIDVPTRREMLASIASIFDPLGLICPIEVEMKNLYQDVCMSKVGWDDKIPENHLKTWQLIRWPKSIGLSFKENIASMTSFTIQ